jgi:hypothetical protein
MGVIKRLIGGFFSFLGGIFKVFNIFKKSEYYLEYDESKSVPQGAAAQPAALAAVATQPAIAPQPAAVAQSAAPAPAKKPSRKAAKAQAESNGDGSMNGKVANSAAAVASTEPVAVNSAAVAATKPSTPAVFAPTYLGSVSSNSRRRPGPSLNRYMEMAKQVTPQK